MLLLAVEWRTCCKSFATSMLSKYVYEHTFSKSEELLHKLKAVAYLRKHLSTRGLPSIMLAL